MNGPESWPQVTRKRSALAWYVDFLLFGVPWALLLWAVSVAIPQIQELGLLPKILVFFVTESLLLRSISWSPGHALLGIGKFTVDPFTTPGAPDAQHPRYVVDPILQDNERRWTLLFGVLAILSGAKAMVRWTMWAPAIPFMGIQLNDPASAMVLLTLGGLECAAGCMALRMRTAVLPLGVLTYGVTLISTLVSWELWPNWIERHVAAGRTLQGLPIREGEVELMQQIVPPGAILIAAVMGVWTLLVALRIRRARSAQPSAQQSNS